LLKVALSTKINQLIMLINCIWKRLFSKECNCQIFKFMNSKNNYDCYFVDRMKNQGVLKTNKVFMTSYLYVIMIWVLQNILVLVGTAVNKYWIQLG
jgi:hypothetical protein